MLARYRQNNTGCSPAMCFPLCNLKIITEILSTVHDAVEFQPPLRAIFYSSKALIYSWLEEFSFKIK
jgi:hypothetical protein